MKEEIDYSDLYGVRVLVFAETSPQSNKYCQVLFSPEMFKNMTATIGRRTGKMVDGMEETIMKTSEEEYDLPDLHESISNYDEI